MFRTFWNNLLQGKRSQAHRLDRRRRLELEALEGRLAPATLTVNSTADTANPDDPYLSLREAIAIVNSPSLPSGLSDQILGQISGTLHQDDADTIRFDPDAIQGPITLGGRQLELRLPGDTATITIDGGAAGVTLDGAGRSRVLMVDPGVQASFAHLSVTHGRDPFADGGGISVSSGGTLTLTNCTVSGNSARQGGGISNAGTLTVIGSTISTNFDEGSVGGGIFNAGTLTVSNSTFAGNETTDQGGGIFNAGTLTVSDCTLTGNLGVEAGGGIFNDHSGTLTVSSSTLSANDTLVGGGIYNGGTLTVSSSTLSANLATEGGGIFNGGTGTMSETLVAANTAHFGGGIYNQGTLTVTDSTLESNSATPNPAFPNPLGGGIRNSGTLTVTSSTLSSNSASSGGGIFNFSVGTLTLQNTIAAGNRSSPDSGPDINGRAQSGSSYNLVGIADSTLSGISAGSQGNQIGTLDSPIDPLLGPLQDNGGPTQTMALLPGSPARGAGDPTDAPEWDQRGPGFPRVVNGAMDIGAYQVQEGEASPRTTAYATETSLASLQAIMNYTLAAAIPEALSTMLSRIQVTRGGHVYPGDELVGQDGQKNPMEYVAWEALHNDDPTFSYMERPTSPAGSSWPDPAFCGCCARPPWSN
jgi:hypothetical protein